MILRFLFILILIQSSLISQTQEKIFFRPYNLSFEMGSRFTTPIGWVMNATGHKTGYKALVDDQNSTSGEQSIALFNYGDVIDGMYGSVFQDVNAIPYRGRTIKISLDVKSDLPHDSSAASFFYHEYLPHNQDGKIDYVQFNSNKEWQRIEVEFSIDKISEYFSFGVTLVRTGTVWMDNITIECVDPLKYNVIPTADSINANELLDFAKLYSIARNYYPSDKFNRMNFEGFLRNGIIETINSNDNISSWKNIFKDIANDITVTSHPLKNTNEDFEEGVAVCQKHTGARSTFSSGYTFSELKNIFVSDRQREAVIMQHIDVDGSGGKRFNWSANVKIDPKSPAAQAQLWTRVITSDKKEMNLYMHHNPIRSTEWSKFEVDSILPENSTRVTIGLVFFGEGSAFFDDIAFNVEANHEFMDKYLIPNNSFELFSDGEPDSWIFPGSVKLAGYKALQSDNSSKGGHCLEIRSNNMFDITYPEPGQIHSEKIDDSYFNIPICKGTELGYINNLNSKINHKYDDIYMDVSDVYSRIGILIEAYSYLSQFQIIDKHLLDSNLVSLIRESLSPQTRSSFLKVIQSLFSITNDSQCKVWMENDQRDHSIPISWDIASGKLVITDSQLDNIPIGSIIQKINGKDYFEIALSNSSHYTGPNRQLNYLRALEEIKIGKKDSELKLTIDSKEVILKRTIPYNKLLGKYKPDISKLSEGVLYINTAKVDDKLFKQIITEANDINSFVFDLRGNMLMSEHFLGFFIDSTIASNNYSIPIYTQPEKLSYLNLPTSIEPKEPRSKAKLYFLCDETTIGYGEAVLHNIKAQSLGRIIGTPSAGMPAEPEPFALPAGYNFSFTVTKTFRYDGNLLNGRQVEPDVIVGDKIEFVNEVFDAQIKKALEIIKN